MTICHKKSAAFGGAPHQSSPGSEEPGDDSFSPRGEAFVPYPQLYDSRHDDEVATRGFSLEGEAVMGAPQARP